MRDELIGLQKDNSTGKVDHSPLGINSKDQADAVCGATFSASQHGDEYAFNFGESIDTMLDVSTNDSDEKKKLFETLPTDFYLKEVEKVEENYFKDFGNGLPQKPDDSFLWAQQGILII